MCKIAKDRKVLLSAMSPRDALGLIETRGLVGSIEAADAALKAADVQIVSRQKVDPGLVTVLLHGDVASVKAAVDAGAAAARKIGELVAAHVIARPGEGVARLEQQPAPAAKPKKVNSRK
jgi:ethanolamine utilization protein EutM